jgi:hypothetical protein
MWFRILTSREEATERQVNYFSDPNEFALFITKLSTKRKMTGKEILGNQETEERRKIEISFRRVAGWALAFTNPFLIILHSALCIQHSAICPSVVLSISTK